MLDRLLCPSVGLPIAGVPQRDLDAIDRVRLLAAKILADAVQDPSGDFAATVALFAAAGPELLTIPQAPTDSMVEAGAAAAGISTEAFRSGYVSAITAFKLGVAA